MLEHPVWQVITAVFTVIGVIVTILFALIQLGAMDNPFAHTPMLPSVISTPSPRGSLTNAPFGSSTAEQKSSPATQPVSQSSSLSIITWIVTGAITGALAGSVMRGGGYGIVGDMIVGIIGALVGGFLLSLFNISWGGYGIELAAAITGACILIAISIAISRAMVSDSSKWLI